METSVVLVHKLQLWPEVARRVLNLVDNYPHLRVTHGRKVIAELCVEGQKPWVMKFLKSLVKWKEDNAIPAP
ncbi:hypothetical protein BHM03_00007558 [Ensete ventricosum]|uniref:Uncharacterized protein n=1 Tax=Ensete ventricosum TaxID=4639 RepID=A0A445MC18_ENSVE|nr:hypothetical protein BHM03_00007558 [Ensete ventricosum]